MHKTVIFKRCLTVLSAVSLLLSMAVPFSVVAEETNGTEKVQSDNIIGALVYSYADYINDSQDSGYEEYAGSALTFGPESISNKDELEKVTVEGVEGFLTDENRPTITYRIQVPVDGLYQMSVRFRFREESGFEGSRQLLIDGKSVYMEADNIGFYRKFTDSSAPRKNAVGDEVQAPAKEILEWQTTELFDNMGRYSKPLTFALRAGEHTVSLVYDKQDVVFHSLCLSAPEQNPTYAEYSTASHTTPSNFSKRFQAETAMLHRNNSAVGLESDGDPLVTPTKPGYLVMNTVGGYTFREGGQAVTFEVEVPAEGWYCLNFRSKQTWAVRMNSYRKIQINGETPFAEMEAFPFHYSNRWENTIPGNDDEIYRYYLKQGKNTITLTAVLGPNTETLRVLEEGLNKLSALSRKITMIIGMNPDPNYDYELEETIPGLKDDLAEVADLLQTVRVACDAQNFGEATVTGNALETNIKMLDEMREDPDRIPKRSGEITNIITSIGDTITTLQNHAVQFDYIEVFSPDVVIKEYHSNFFDKLVTTFKSLIVSFQKDYTAVSFTGDISEKKVLDVWVGRGKEWAEIMKELVDSDFSAKTGIQLNFNIVPSGSLATSGSANLLLLSVSAGTEPDMAMGVPTDTPVEYAIRGVVQDFSKMEGYEELIGRFPNKSMVSLLYEGGAYGIPETINFRGMFYRKDILTELNIPLPETWDDVFNHLVPTLNENGMQFYLPNWYDSFFLSHGGSYYKTDENGHLKSALDSAEIYDAFKMVTDAYVVHGLPTSASFLNRFRTGEMPIGLGDNAFYLSLIAVAPELSNKWEMLPIPDVVRSDGTRAHKYPGMVSSTLVLLKSSIKADIAWQFIDWWTSAETQKNYALQVEGRIGQSARWLSANMEAFLSLPWEKSVRETIKDEWNNLVGIPTVPGGYYTFRHVNNAWNRVVLNGMLPRESLEKTVKDINKELDRKREQLAKN